MVEEYSNWLPELWYMMLNRIAPELCCLIPPPVHQLFKLALHEVARQDGDLDKAIEILYDILSNAPTTWLVFTQASQLLNIIGWRRSYHPEWFTISGHKRRNHPGRCGPHLAHAMALMQVGSDEDALNLCTKIVEKGDPGSDDAIVAHLITACILICQGDIDEGEEELKMITKIGH